jgi:hypothetical protein
MPLKKGTWVKLKGHETFGTIVEQRRGDAQLPEQERSYKIHVEEQNRLRTIRRRRESAPLGFGYNSVSITCRSSSSFNRAGS